MSDLLLRAAAHYKIMCDSTVTDTQANVVAHDQYSTLVLFFPQHLFLDT